MQLLLRTALGGMDADRLCRYALLVDLSANGCVAVMYAADSCMGRHAELQIWLSIGLGTSCKCSKCCKCSHCYLGFGVGNRWAQWTRILLE
jgi:hypothetical protein